jgi:hypothetical protein
MAQILGWDYAWMLGCTFAVLGVCLGFPQLAGNVPRVLRIAALIYAWLALITVTGGALHANRAGLERETLFFLPRERPVSAQEMERLREQWLDSIYAAWRSQAHEEAWRAVIARIAQSAEPLQELRWLYARVADWERPPFANRIVREMLPHLLAADQEGEALRLVKERLAADPRFRPQAEGERRRLAQLAGEWGDRSTAETLLRDLTD